MNRGTEMAPKKWVHEETILVDGKKCWTKSGHSSYNHNLCSKYHMNSPAFYHWIKFFAVWGCLDASHTHVFRSATTNTPRNAFPTTCMNLPLRSLLQFPCWNPARNRTCQHNVGWLAFTTKDPSQKKCPSKLIASQDSRIFGGYVYIHRP